MFRVSKSAAGDRTLHSLCVEATSARFTAEQAVELIFSDLQQGAFDLED